MALAAVHPDKGSGGDLEAYVELLKQREQWRKLRYAKQSANARRCACGAISDSARTDGACSPLCGRRLEAQPKQRLALKPAPRVSRCQAPNCQKLVIPKKSRRPSRPPQRFCSKGCAGRWALSLITPEDRRRRGRRAAAVNRMRSSRRRADRFRHIENMDERVNAAYKAGYDAGYHACLARVRAGLEAGQA